MLLWLANLDFAGGEAAAPVVTPEPEPTGGFPVGRVHPGPWEKYVREVEEREERRRELKARARAVQDKLDRELALELRKQQDQNERAEELKRLKALADKYSDEAQLKLLYGDRIAYDIMQVALVGNYSAVERLDRELRRMMEEEQFFMEAMQILLYEQ